MTSASDQPALTDEQLTAYLDGELPLESRGDVNRMLADSDIARERLEFLRQGGEHVDEALDLMLDGAPMERLRASIPDVTPLPAAHAGPAVSSAVQAGWAPMAAAAAVLLALFGGFLGGVLMPDPAAEPTVAEAPAVLAPAARGWRQAVADYQVLFTAESLTPYQGGDSGLDLANASVGFDLAGLTGDIGSLNFRRVQVLRFGDKPLVQFAYLSADQQPVSFCIIASGKQELPEAFETRNDLGIVHWAHDGFGFMLIGDMSEDQLNAIASGLRSRIRA